MSFSKSLTVLSVCTGEMRQQINGVVCVWCSPLLNGTPDASKGDLLMGGHEGEQHTRELTGYRCSFYCLPHLAGKEFPSVSSGHFHHAFGPFSEPGGHSLALNEAWIGTFAPVVAEHCERSTFVAYARALMQCL